MISTKMWLCLTLLSIMIPQPTLAQEALRNVTPEVTSTRGLDDGGNIYADWESAIPLPSSTIPNEEISEVGNCVEAESTALLLSGATPLPPHGHAPMPTLAPSAKPSGLPTAQLSDAPSSLPVPQPTPWPIRVPTSQPSHPTPETSLRPSLAPSPRPSHAPLPAPHARAVEHVLAASHASAHDPANVHSFTTTLAGAHAADVGPEP